MGTHSGIHERFVQLLSGSLVLREGRVRQERVKEHILPTLAWKTRAFMGTQRYQSRKQKAHVPAASDLMLLFMAMLPNASVEAQRCGTRFSLMFCGLASLCACRCHKSMSSVFFPSLSTLFIFKFYAYVHMCVSVWVWAAPTFTRTESQIPNYWNHRQL